MKIEAFISIFFHPDYTVGFGITPKSAIINRSRTCRFTPHYRRWGITPRPEDLFSFYPPGCQ